MIDTYATARQMLADLNAKKISARELLDAHLARNDAIHGTINAINATDIERAREEADAIDAARTKGTALGPLAGLPMTIKDGYDVENMPALAGNPALVGRPKNCADAALVRTVRDAGAVIWGKTNVPFMLSDLQSYNAITGTTNNPYDVTRTPGGSSGGAAAALACGVTPLEIGSDIGGSLRHPANFTGVTSLKTTWGALDGRGHIPPMPDGYWECDLGVYGPMARNTGDLKLLWGLLKGTPEQARRDIKGARVAVWDEEPSWPLARDVKDGVVRAATALEQAGAMVERTKPKVDGAVLMDFYLQLLTPIVSYGMPEQMLDAFATMREADRKTVAEGGPGAGFAQFRLYASAPNRDVIAAQIKRQAYKDILAEFFTGYDAIVMPITMTTAFKHLQEPTFQERVLEIDGVAVPYPTILNWISLATALHLPALAVQAGQTAAGLPVGVQIVGPWNGEDRLFDFAAAVEEGCGGFRRPPGV
ncbi:MAG: amidase [Proteobacteria bacterium]|nr:amidase [Pseudomonadota bacterium]